MGVPFVWNGSTGLDLAASQNDLEQTGSAGALHYCGASAVSARRRVALEQPHREQRCDIAVGGTGVHVQHPRELGDSEVAAVVGEAGEYEQPRKKRSREPTVIHLGGVGPIVGVERERPFRVFERREKYRHGPPLASGANHLINLSFGELDQDCLAGVELGLAGRTPPRASGPLPLAGRRGLG